MDQEHPDRIKTVVRTMQIILLSMASGLLLFTLVVYVVQLRQPPPADGGVLLSALGAALTVTAILARIVVPALMVRSGCQRIARGAPHLSAAVNAQPAPPA